MNLINLIKNQLHNIILHVGIYAKNVLGSIGKITTWKAHTGIFSELSRLYIDKCNINIEPSSSTNSKRYNKIYGTINTNNSYITVENLYYNQSDKSDNLRVPFDENTDGNFNNHFVSNLTEIRQCL
jgi:hypothetical protein